MRLFFVVFVLAFVAYAQVLEDKPGHFVLVDSVQEKTLSACNEGKRILEAQAAS